ncbi:MAG: hypothetical protein WBA91_06545 [Paracoccaceae bacterium]
MSDLVLLGGVFAVLLSVAALISAFSGTRSMRAPVTLLLIGLGLIGLASYLSPVGYSAQDIPKIIMRLISDLAN